MIRITLENENVSGFTNELEKLLQLLGGELLDGNNGGDQDNDDVDDDTDDDGTDDNVNPYAWLNKYSNGYENTEPDVKALWKIIPNLKNLYDRNRITIRIPSYTKTGKIKVNGTGNPILMPPREVADKIFLYPGDVFWGWRRSFQADNWKGKEICEPALTAVPEIFVKLVSELRDGAFIEA